MENNTAPAPRRRAYVPVFAADGTRMGIAVEGEAGYTPISDAHDLGGIYGSREEAKRIAVTLNATLGLTEHEADLIVWSTMAAQNREDRHRPTPRDQHDHLKGDDRDDQAH